MEAEYNLTEDHMFIGEEDREAIEREVQNYKETIKDLSRDQLLEFDKRFNESFEIFGIHTCNWSIDSYLDALVEIDGLAYLDMGADTDIERVHELFPGICPSVFFHPEKLRGLSEQEIEREITKLGKRIGRGYILFSDLEVGTTDSQIRVAYEAAASL